MQDRACPLHPFHPDVSGKAVQPGSRKSSCAPPFLPSFTRQVLPVYAIYPLLCLSCHHWRPATTLSSLDNCSNRLHALPTLDIFQSIHSSDVLFLYFFKVSVSLKIFFKCIFGCAGLMLYAGCLSLLCVGSSLLWLLLLQSPSSRCTDS